MWLLSHDAVCLANPPFLAKLLAYRDYQRALQSNEMMKTLYESLQVFVFKFCLVIHNCLEL